MQKLKEEINIRYRIMRYKKLMKHFLYNRFEKNNVEIIYEAIGKTRNSSVKADYLDFFYIPAARGKKKLDEWDTWF